MRDRMIADDDAGESTFPVEAADEGERLDAFLVKRFPHFSRTQIRKAIEDGLAFVDGTPAKVGLKLKLGQAVAFTPPLAPPAGSLPEDIPLDVVYEDDDLAVINKSAGMVVHPGRGNWSGTLTSAISFRFAELSQTGGPTRPGIVHRLDRDTSGLIVIAKHDAAHLALTRQFEERTVEKRYVALVHPAPDRDRDIIDEPIGAHPYQREKMAIRRNHAQSREAVTFYEVVERFGGVAIVHAHPKTGRTHQIRLHMTHVGSPILCDKLYGGRARATARELIGLCGRGADHEFGTNDPPADEVLLDRQALHAQALSFLHPSTGKRLSFECELAPDLARCVELLRRKTGKKSG